MKIRAREGDFIEDLNGIVFDVKGLIHPTDKIVAFPRFIPDSSGNRKRGNVSYGKVYSLSERFRFLEQNFPHYLIFDSVFDETLCEVPFRDVRKHHNPIEKLQKLCSSKVLDELESLALRLTELLKENANISWSAIGISGSVLVGLHRVNSDIDPVVYGSANCQQVYSALGSMLKDKQSPFKPYNREDLETLFDFRSKDTTMGFEDFVRTESRKVLQGKFMGMDYFMRFVKDWGEFDESYGDVQYKNVGYAKIEAEVVDDSEAIFTPCTYKIESAKSLEGPKFEPISEIVSFRGRFCEQVRTGEAVVAQGKVERVTDRRRNHEYFRLLVGSKPSDHMFTK
jgi:hypothetical protein